MQADCMFEISDKLRNLRNEKDDMERILKEINSEIDKAEYQLSELMTENRIQNFTRDGTMFYLTAKTRASAVAGSKDGLYDALKAHGFGDLVYETVNANLLSSFIKGQIEENNDSLPDWLVGLVNVSEKVKVTVKKATNNQ